MRSNTTQFRRFNAGPPKKEVLKTNRKTFSSDLSDNYKLALQLYSLNKKQSEIKKEVKYTKPYAVAVSKVTIKPSYSLISGMKSIFTVNFSFLKKLRNEIALVIE